VGPEHQIHSLAGVRLWPDFNYLVIQIHLLPAYQVNVFLVKLAEVVTFTLMNELVCWLKIATFYSVLKKALCELLHHLW